MNAEYPNKPYADFTTADRIAMRRYHQGEAHALQGRTDLLGLCDHYDAGYRVSLARESENRAARDEFRKVKVAFSKGSRCSEIDEHPFSGAVSAVDY